MSLKKKKHKKKHSIKKQKGGFGGLLMGLLLIGTGFSAQKNM